MVSQVRSKEDESPGLKKGGSPTKIGSHSPSKLNKSPTKVSSKARREAKNTVKKEDGHDQRESGLASPTSISMQNSFIIKNADSSFDAYYQQMRKRKLG